MAKVKIQGHASGTGVLTVTAPNTSTDRTITLPDATGTLLNSDGSGANLTSLPADATKVPLAGGTMTGNLLVEKTSAASAVIRSKGSYADGYRHGFEAVNGHTGGLTWSMFSTNNSDGTFDGGSLVFSTGIASSANAGTSKLQITSDGRGLSQFTAKAWCAWDATGTPAITDSHNVSSLTDAGTGEQKLNFTNNLATADAYTVSALASKGGGAPSSSNNATCTIGSSLPVTGPYIGVIFNGSASDRDYVCATCFGD